MRKPFIVLFIAALLVVGAGAVNYTVSVDLSYFFGEVRGVSLLWCSVGVAAFMVVVAFITAFSARRAALRAQHGLELELEKTYRRLRELEASSSTSSEPAGSAAAPAGAPGTSPSAPDESRHAITPPTPEEEAAARVVPKA